MLVAYYDGDGSENVSWKFAFSDYKKLYRDYCNSFSLPRVVELSWNWIRKSHVQVKEKFVVACLVRHPL